MLKKILFFIIYFLLISGVFICSFWINLDPQTITPWLENTINSRLPRQYTITIESADNYLLGTTIKQMALKDTVSNEPLVLIDVVDIRVNPISLLFFQEVNSNVTLYQGTVAAVIDLFPKVQIDFKINEIQINQNRFIRKTKLIWSNPEISGEGSYQFHDSSAELSLSCSALELKGKPKDTNLLFEVPRTRFKKIDTEAKITKNNLTLRLKSSGDIVANINGVINLNPANPGRSKMDLRIAAGLTEKYETSLGFISSFLVNYKDNNGQLSLNVSGTFQRPNFRKHDPNQP